MGHGPFLVPSGMRMRPMPSSAQDGPVETERNGSCPLITKSVLTLLPTPASSNVTRRGEQVADMCGYAAFVRARAIDGLCRPLI